MAALIHITRTAEAGGTASWALRFPNLSLPSGSMADALSDRVRILILPSPDEGYLPLVCAHTLWRKAPPRNTSLRL